MAGKGKIDRQKVLKAVRDNPDLPPQFVEECMASMAEPRDSCTPFIPRSLSNADQFRTRQTRVGRLFEFLKSLPNRRGARRSRSDLYD